MLYTQNRLKIFYGDKNLGISRDFFLQDKSLAQLISNAAFVSLKQQLDLDSFAFLKQMHGNQGYSITPRVKNLLLTTLPEGDFLVTQVKNIGLGIYTADCLPIIFYDSYNQVIALCHAGWSGSVKQVAIKTVETIKQEYNTQLHNLKIFFGPSAQACCYEVSPEFKDILGDSDSKGVILERDNKLFFDLLLYNKLQLEKLGIPSENFDATYCQCTICNDRFCSYRRDKDKSLRQLTIVALAT